MLFDAHTRSFAALGGVARRGIYDNMRTVVDKVHKGKVRTVNARFAVMCAHYLYDPDFCNVASGWEKGWVEKNVQDSRRRIWIDAAKHRFGRRAWEGEGLPGEPVREMLIQAVERRFGSVEAVHAGHKLEFLSDNGGAHIAADTRALARSLGLQPINTPVCSPQSNGMAESFVNTFKRDYVALHGPA